jgi:hypothetical protein
MERAWATRECATRVDKKEETGVETKEVTTEVTRVETEEEMGTTTRPWETTPSP